MFKNYHKKSVQPMRPYEPGEDMAGISVNKEDTPELGGMIAVNPANGDDRWYVAKQFFEDNYIETTEPQTKPLIGQSSSNAGLDAMTNFWCEVCNKIQPTFFEGAHNKNTSGEFVGGDIVCKECNFIIATAYAPNTELTRTA